MALCIMAVPATVIYFTCYDQLRAALRVRMGSHAEEAPLLAGALARVGSVTVISPLELIRTKMQSQRSSYRELSEVIHSAVRNEGWRSLWRGWGPTLLRDVPFSAMYWYNYEKGKAWLCKHNNIREPTFAITFISGAVSGSISSIVTLPFDVVKTRRQVEIGELQAMNLSSKASSSTLSVMTKIVAENGVGGLFVVPLSPSLPLLHPSLYPFHSLSSTPPLSLLRFSSRFPSQGGQGGPSLCHYDQLL
ncbi:solute carrier family 25 member 40-like isoform X1 [Oncorhynchus tshawytscha]|uniref:solute carrier family 25 member 40-like isoform X1 n=1 Tax=Oncorhynchus tshawytscha TaxID=74940 RepID=UPI001C3DB1CA|nr:solute carrier family 25 member 40-like isoform X1 [Oncorhynchus tshawytscha]XP_042162925.1 solute carrier family 25 member 40-like isoform X1 [Oncorhynchus tshawytscha]